MDFSSDSDYNEFANETLPFVLYWLKTEKTLFRGNITF